MKTSAKAALAALISVLGEEKAMVQVQKGITAGTFTDDLTTGEDLPLASGTLGKLMKGDLGEGVAEMLVKGMIEDGELADDLGIAAEEIDVEALMRTAENLQDLAKGGDAPSITDLELPPDELDDAVERVAHVAAQFGNSAQEAVDAVYEQGQDLAKGTAEMASALVLMAQGLNSLHATMRSIGAKMDTLAKGTVAADDDGTQGPKADTPQVEVDQAQIVPHPGDKPLNKGGSGAGDPNGETPKVDLLEAGLIAKREELLAKSDRDADDDALINELIEVITEVTSTGATPERAVELAGRFGITGVA